ncbi:hypothetical protein B7494_g8126 [Chlorociboria aeruginascens]|nr:hypothetical protein B7494_g8126 [Chlorociboria aeruginascens]
MDIDISKSIVRHVCDCDASTPPKNSLSKSRSPTPSLQLSSVEDKPGDAKTWRLIFPEVQSRSPEPQVSCSPTLDLLDALAIDLISHDRPSTQSITNVSNICMNGAQENTAQLVRETNEVVEPLVANMDTTAHDASTASLCSTTTTAHSLLKRGYSPPITRPKIPLLKQFPIGKGKTSTNKKVEPAGQPSSDYTINTQKYVKMVLDGYGRILRTNNAIESKKKRHASFAPSRKRDTDERALLEPLHLESTTLYTNASGFPPPPFPSPFLPPPAVPTKRKLGRERDPQIPLDTRPMIFKDLSFPSPPRIPLNRPQSRLTSHLPTIPETYPLIFTPPIKPTKSPSNYLYLLSTPFTLTSPLFRHGPIRLNRSPWGRKDSKVLDEILDWTAFQMAISGNIDMEIADYRDDGMSDEIELDELAEWWGGFGFQGMGVLVNNAPTREQVSLDESPEMEDWKGGLWARTIRNQGVHAEELGERLRDMGMEKELALAESPSPSPLQDCILFPKGEIVPMGSNLGYDLGDFSWDNYHMMELSKND